MSDIGTMRLLTEWTGAVTEAQIVTLKRCTMLITNSDKISLAFDPGKKIFTYLADTDENEVEGRMMSEMVGMVLGRGWTVARGIVENDAPKSRPARKSRRLADRKGTRGSRKARKRSR